jgi:hypothetical protein
MKAKTFFKAVPIVLILVLAIPSLVSAAVVGKLTQVQGRVDVLRGGKLPAITVKVGDSVESGDVLRCKALSKAQITFMDNSIVTLSPESRFAINDYTFEPSKHQRHAVLQLFKGLAYVVVNKLYKVEQPDFIVKTQTAITGVRGTELSVDTTANNTTISVFDGKVLVANIFSEVGISPQVTEKPGVPPAATRLGKPAGPPATLFSPGRSVEVGSMEATVVERDRTPTLPYAITDQDRQLIMQRLDVKSSSQQSKLQVLYPAIAAPAPPAPQRSIITYNIVSGSFGLGNGTPGNIWIIVNISRPNYSTPSSSTFSISQNYYSAWIQPSDLRSITISGWGQRTGVYAGYFNTSTTVSGISMTSGVGIGDGTYAIATSSGKVSGISGQTLQGNMDLFVGGTQIAKGTVVLNPSGQLTYNWTITRGEYEGVTGTATQIPTVNNQTPISSATKIDVTATSSTAITPATSATVTQTQYGVVAGSSGNLTGPASVIKSVNGEPSIITPAVGTATLSGSGSTQNLTTAVKTTTTAVGVPVKITGTVTTTPTIIASPSVALAVKTPSSPVPVTAATPATSPAPTPAAH